MRRKKCETTLNIKNVGLVGMVTMTGFARIIGKSRDTILRYEKNDIFPPALVTIKGVRYWPVSLAEKIAPIVKRFPRHRPPSAETIVKINKIFSDERRKLCPS